MAHCCSNSATKPDERSSGENDYILEKLILFHSCILTSRAVFQDIPVGEGGEKMFYELGLVNSSYTSSENDFSSICISQLTVQEL